MGKVSFLERELVITSNEVLLKATLDNMCIDLSLAGRGWKAKSVLMGPSVVRFIGACIASGYGLSEFGVEVVGGVQVEHEKLRIIKEGSTNDRGLIRLNPEEFLFLGIFCSKEINYKQVQLEFQENFLTLSKEGSFFKILLRNTKGMEESALLVEKPELYRFFCSLLASALGREKQAQRMAGEESYIKVKEKVEIKDDMQKIIEVSTQSSVQRKTLEEWVAFFNNTAQTAGKNPHAVLKSFLRKHSIPYSSKVSISINDVEVRIPPHWALGLYHCFEKHLL